MTTGEAVASAGYLYGRPIVAAMPAHARGAVVAHAVGYVYDYFSESSASSSSSYQQNGGAGGNNKSYRPDHSAAKIARMSRSERNRVCRDGFDLRKVGGKWMCVPRTSKKSRSR